MEQLGETFSVTRVRRALISPRDARDAVKFDFASLGTTLQQRKANSSAMRAGDREATGRSPTISLV